MTNLFIQDNTMAFNRSFANQCTPVHSDASKNKIIFPIVGENNLSDLT